MQKITLLLAALTLISVALEPASAQGPRWSVFYTANTNPRTLGVAVSTWSRPGWSRMATYSSSAAAWRKACSLHFNNRSYFSPDIAARRVNCNALR